MAPLSFRSSDYFFAQIASIQFKELFNTNLSFKGGTVHLNRSIRIEATHQNVFSVRSQLLRFYSDQVTLTLKQKVICS